MKEEKVKFVYAELTLIDFKSYENEGKGNPFW